MPFLDLATKEQHILHKMKSRLKNDIKWLCIVQAYSCTMHMLILPIQQAWEWLAGYAGETSLLEILFLTQFSQYSINSQRNSSIFQDQFVE